MGGRIDVPSIYRTHVIKQLLDDDRVELWCGRTGTRDGIDHTPSPLGKAVCDSCRAAAAFTCDLDMHW